MVTEQKPGTTLEPLDPGLPPIDRHAQVPGGFAAGGFTAGIKASGKPDLMIVLATDGPAAAAAVFTPNVFAAAPVRLSQRHLAVTDPAGHGRYGWADAVISTSGCANAATGEGGMADQAAIADALAEAVKTTPERTLALSTGLIGTRLPVETVVAGIGGLLEAGLGTDADALESAAIALRTTDSRTKIAGTSVELPATDGTTVTVHVSGIAKGVGMIHPRMATMLSVVMTDASAEPAVLHAMLRTATVRTWDQLTVDGDTSTNDTVFLLASGASRAAPVVGGSDPATRLGRAIEAVARDLARQQAADGEGATTLLTCQVSGATDDVDARAVARAVVSSSLLKAAVHGRDPNWGRIAGATGNARIPEAAILEAAGLSPVQARDRAGTTPAIDPEKLRIAIAGTLVFDGAAGGPQPFNKAAVSHQMNTPETIIRLDLGLGEGVGEAFGCDLTEAYVIENSEYST